MTDATPAPLGAPLVVVNHVQKHYGEFQALTDIDLTVHTGEVSSASRAANIRTARTIVNSFLMVVPLFFCALRVRNNSPSLT